MENTNQQKRIDHININKAFLVPNKDFMTKYVNKIDTSIQIIFKIIPSTL